MIYFIRIIAQPCGTSPHTGEGISKNIPDFLNKPMFEIWYEFCVVKLRDRAPLKRSDYKVKWNKITALKNIWCFSICCDRCKFRWFCWFGLFKAFRPAASAYYLIKRQIRKAIFSSKHFEIALSKRLLLEIALRNCLYISQ